MVGHRVEGEAEDIVVVPLVHANAHVLRLLAWLRRPSVERDQTVVVLTHRRNVRACAREGESYDGALVVALDAAQLRQQANLAIALAEYLEGE